MDITALLKSFIYLAASSLLLPVLLLLTLLTIWLIFYSGSFAGLWLQRRRLPRPKDTILALRSLKLAGFPAPVRSFVQELEQFATHPDGPIACLNLLRDSELQLWRTLDRLKMVIRIGPGLGLIGTLIPMGTGLASLGQGDLSRLSGDLVIAFTTTVVGMSLGLTSYFLFTIQRRWVEEDVKNMELAAEVLMGEKQ